MVGYSMYDFIMDMQNHDYKQSNGSSASSNNLLGYYHTYHYYLQMYYNIITSLISMWQPLIAQVLLTMFSTAHNNLYKDTQYISCCGVMNYMCINGFQLLIYMGMQMLLCLLILPDQIHQSPTLYRNGTFGRGLRKLKTFQS